MPLEDLQQASLLLIQALNIRENYMHLSAQNFPTITSRFLSSVDGATAKLDDFQHDDRKTIAGKLIVLYGCLKRSKIIPDSLISLHSDFRRDSRKACWNKPPDSFIPDFESDFELDLLLRNVSLKGIPNPDSYPLYISVSQPGE